MALFSSFPLRAAHVSTGPEWRARAKGLGARTMNGAARAYARQNGIAVMMMPNDDARVFALDHESGKLREWTHPRENLEWVA